MPRAGVIILGAGISGLTLGRALLKRGVRAALYDHASNHTGRHNHAISLHASTCRSLLGLLRMDEATFYRRVAVDADLDKNEPVALSAHLHPEFKPPLRVNRGKLESLLAEGLDVRWDQHVKVERDGDIVQLRLSNGSQIIPEFLIGGDGALSIVRSTLIPGMRPKVLPYAVFNGKRRIGIDAFDEHYRSCFSHSTSITLSQDEYLLGLSISGVEPEYVELSWTFSRPARGIDDPLYRPQRSAAEAKKIPSVLYEEIDNLKPLRSPFHDIFSGKEIRNDRTLHWLMRKVNPDASALLSLFSSTKTILIGDSAHAEPILGGQGANAAVQDGIELGERLASATHADIATWYRQRVDEWQAGVNDSETDLATMHHSIV